ncbi:MAG: HK97 family phage prohead protease [Erysipelotrichaceae bacterium]|nr:HK97 family phage prohead protease [Erysipelotrichaceae bacterium]
MPSNEREYRNMELRIAPIEEGAEPSFFVEGHAATFEPYVLMTIDDIDYSERIMPDAFEGADLSDVVFRVDHTGPVYARTSAGTVEVWTDERGLAQKTDLGMTARGRELFADIAAGNYPQMSFAFRVAEDHYDKATHTRVIDRIDKVYDVSPVCFPANPTTDLCISTRDYFNGVIEAERAERLEAEKRERQKQKIRILSEVH